jgi:hypothetical protein
MSASSSAVVPENCQWLLRAVYAAHPERFVQKPPQLPVLPHAVWINPPKEQSASQDRADATSSTADDLRVVLCSESRRRPRRARITLSRFRHARFYTICSSQVS